MTAKLIEYANETVTDFKGGPSIIQAIVRLHTNKEKLVVTNSNCEDINLFVKRSRSVRPHGLIIPEQRTFLQNTTCLHERVNNGMARKEVINIIVDLYGAKTQNQEDNHIDYFIISVQLPDLKSGGRVIFT